MRKYLFFVLLIFTTSCGNRRVVSEKPVITVSIAPYKYIVEAIAGDEYDVNVMVPQGASPHSYEPYPEQIKQLRKSKAFVANGYLDFELAWLEKFMSANPNMEVLKTSNNISLLESTHHHETEEHHDAEGHHEEMEEHHGTDPHFWVSPKRGMSIASSIKDFLCTIEPAKTAKYENNCQTLMNELMLIDRQADSLFSTVEDKSFIIYHPNLAYLAEDYNLVEYSIEKDGKEPSPSYLKELIDFAKGNRINTIFIQKEFDKRYAQTIAEDINAKVVVIDPLAGDWLSSMKMIITELYKSFSK